MHIIYINKQITNIYICIPTNIYVYILLNSRYNWHPNYELYITLTM